MAIEMCIKHNNYNLVKIETRHWLHLLSTQFSGIPAIPHHWVALDLSNQTKWKYIPSGKQTVCY